jgi:general secretion pathway protein H
MPTSVPGSSCSRHGRTGRAGGFTLIELLLVIAIVAISVGVVALSLRDSSEARLDEEAARLGALFEMARAESRASGMAVQWVPSPAVSTDSTAAQFRFIGLRAAQTLPQRWLDPSTQVDIVGARVVVLGPEAIVGAQRVVLRLGERRVEIATDGLSPFAVAAPAAGTR